MYLFVSKQLQNISLKSAGYLTWMVKTNLVWNAIYEAQFGKAYSVKFMKESVICWTELKHFPFNMNFYFSCFGP